MYLFAEILLLCFLTIATNFHQIPNFREFQVQKLCHRSQPHQSRQRPAREFRTVIPNVQKRSFCSAACKCRRVPACCCSVSASSSHTRRASQSHLAQRAGAHAFEHFSCQWQTNGCKRAPVFVTSKVCESVVSSAAASEEDNFYLKLLFVRSALSIFAT